MTGNPINDFAAIVRQHPNDVPLTVLADSIAAHFERPDLAAGIADTIYAINPGRTLGAAALAETLWDTFTHDGELPVTATESASEGAGPVRTYPNGDQKYGPYRQI